MILLIPHTLKVSLTLDKYFKLNDQVIKHEKSGLKMFPQQRGISLNFKSLVSCKYFYKARFKVVKPGNIDNVCNRIYLTFCI